MASKDHYGAFGSDLIFQGVVAVPKVLLHNYTRLELRDAEVLLILHLLSLREREPYPSPRRLGDLMGLDTGQVEAMLGRLVEEKIIAIEQIYDSEKSDLIPAYSLTGLMEKLSEFWAVDKHYRQEQAKKIKKGGVTSDKLATGVKTLVKTFEKEFGRPLTEIECSNIIEWHDGSGFSQELILEALKRAVLNQTTNWRYINSILREWDRKNLRTLQEVWEDDAKFQARQGKQKFTKPRNHTGRPPDSVDKFKDFSL